MLRLRGAGDRLGVTASAVSQTLRRLEKQLGVALAHRTSRSMRLTEAGEQLYAKVRPALEEVRAAASAVGSQGNEPRGTLRLHVAGVAESFLGGPMLDGYLAAHPHVRLEMFVSDEPLDIVAAGYDAGVRLGEVIDGDMIAVPLTGDQRLVVVGAPSYFARHPKPVHPRDLAQHECLNWRPTADAPGYRWEFTENGRDFSVAVPSRALTNLAPLLLRLARDGDSRCSTSGRCGATSPAATSWPCWRSTRRRSPGSTSSIQDGATPRCRSARWSTSSGTRGSGHEIRPEVGGERACRCPRRSRSGDGLGVLSGPLPLEATMRNGLGLAFLLAALVAAPGTAAAQAETPAQAAARFRLERPAPAPALFTLPDSVARKKDHTITGLLVGAGLGAALGYGFYNAMCEAADNHCSGSRTHTMVVSAAAVGALGALIGAISSP